MDRKIELFVIRDAATNEVLEVSIDCDDAEYQTTLYLGTHSGEKDAPLPTQPVLESYRVTLDDPTDEPRSGESLLRRVETRKRREQVERDALMAELKR